jgi:hypothetical protein
MNVLFVNNKTSKSLQTVLKELSDLPEFLLESDYGNFTVKLKEADKVKTHSLVSELTLVFNERVPLFDAVLYPPISGNEISIDGYDLKKSFGINVAEIKPLEQISKSKSSNTTIYNSSQSFSEHRSFKVFEMDCFVKYSTKSILSETTEKFKKLLSQEGYRIINFNNENYNCFLTEGFKIILIGDDLVKFKLRLNITANFLDSGFVNNGFVN